MAMRVGQDELESGCDLIEVTSLHRPDISWRYVDAIGHVHQWHVGGKPATLYRPGQKYETPTLVWVKDGEEYWEDDDEPHDVGHLECVLCAEHVKPAYRADDTVQYMPGIRWFRINGQYVTEEEFRAKCPK